jgi:hypothetical protein
VDLQDRRVNSPPIVRKSFRPRKIIIAENGRVRSFSSVLAGKQKNRLPVKHQAAGLSSMTKR